MGNIGNGAKTCFTYTVRTKHCFTMLLSSLFWFNFNTININTPRFVHKVYNYLFVSLTIYRLCAQLGEVHVQASHLGDRWLQCRLRSLPLHGSTLRYGCGVYFYRFCVDVSLCVAWSLLSVGGECMYLARFGWVVPHLNFHFPTSKLTHRNHTLHSLPLLTPH